MMKLPKFGLVFLFVLYLTSILSAQDGTCGDLPRNQLCYVRGQVLINDIAINEVGGEHIPLEPGQVLRTVVDEEEIDALAGIEVVTGGGTNLRDGPGTDFRILGSVGGGQRLFAIGRNRTGSWLYVVQDDGTSAWLSTSTINTQGDIESLSAVDQGGANQTTSTVVPSVALVSVQADFPILNSLHKGSLVLFGNTEIRDISDEGSPPFQKITLTTVGESSGLLMQSPQRAGIARIILNDISLELIAATAYVVTDPVLTIYVLDGMVQVLQSEDTVTVPAGTRFSLIPDGVSEVVAPYTTNVYAAAQTGALPLDTLPRAIEPTPPLETIPTENIVPREGTWTTTYGAGYITCDEIFDGEDNSLLDIQALHQLAVHDEDDSLTITKIGNGDLLTAMQRIENEIFAGNEQVFSGGEDISLENHTTLWLFSSTQLEGQRRILLENGCESWLPFSMQFGG